MPTVYSKNRDQLVERDIAGKFFAQVLDQARTAGLLSDERFVVDGTMIDAWASHKSFRRKDGQGSRSAARMTPQKAHLRLATWPEPHS